MHSGRHEGENRGKVFGWLMAISVVVLLLPTRWTERLDRGFGRFVGPLSKEGRDFSLAVTEDLRPLSGEKPTYRDFQELTERYEALFRRTVNLEAELEVARRENERWSGVREEMGRARVALLPTAVLGSGSSEWSRTVVIDRGRVDGVSAGQVVLGGAEEEEEGWSASVVGRVVDAGERTSQVQLVHDPGFRLPVYVSPAGAQGAWRADGVLKGGRLGEVVVEFVSAEYPVERGDWVLACSDPGYLPVATVVGQVIGCEREPDNPVFWRLRVSPTVDLHDVRELLVVVPRWQQGR